MSILLPWEVSKIEKHIFMEGLKKYDPVIIETTELSNIPKNLLPNVEILVAGLANKEIIQECPNLKYIQSMISAASHVDQTAAQQRNILFATTKGSNAFSVMEQVYFLMLSCAKNSKKYVSDVENNIWEKVWHDNLAGRNLGVIGIGEIGSRVCYMGKAFGMNVSGIRRRTILGDKGLELDFFGGPDDLTRVLAWADYTVLSVPKVQDTLSLLGSQELQKMKNGSYLINVSRGPVVDENAIFDAIQTGRLKGYGTDVFVKEPNSFKEPLFNHRNVFCTPHVGANSIDSKIACMEKVVNNIHKYYRGEKIDNIVDYELGY
ncbi:MAG: NAD(P)-dependent oxidoreductase [Candidatus Woesearchaeota archaeon]